LADDHRLLPRFRSEIEHAVILARETARAAASEVPVSSPRYAGGDPLSLRGIPAIGRSVSGAIPGTVPGSAR
jgi:hypothetical protein